MYIYGVISFVLIPNYFDPEDDLFCGTLFQCFISITRIGLLDTLGVVSHVIGKSIIMQQSQAAGYYNYGTGNIP